MSLLKVDNKSRYEVRWAKAGENDVVETVTKNAFQLENQVVVPMATRGIVRRVESDSESDSSIDSSDSEGEENNAEIGHIPAVDNNV